jgi:hypothetical protein
VKIFISYSRADASNFAKHIHKYLRENSHSVFIDVNSITIGDPWASSIEKNISECDIFIVILTPDSLRSNHVEREVLQAQREKKIVVPCIHEYVEYNEIPWGLQENQGIEFSDKYELALNLYPKIKNYNNILVNRSDDANTTINKSNSESLYNNKNILQTPKKERTILIGNELDTSKDTVKKYSFIKSWGSNGFGDGEFYYPFGIAVDSKCYVYVSDTLNTRIQKFDINGNFITKWGCEGKGDGEFNLPKGIAIDSKGYVYVADVLNHRIQKFDNNGNFITKWGSEGKGDGELDHPLGISIDSKGYVYVAHEFKDIQKFDNNGNFITK